MAAPPLAPSSPSLLAGNLIVDALHVEGHTKDLAIIEVGTALAFDGVAVLRHDRTLERMKSARSDLGLGVRRHLLHVVWHVSEGRHHHHFAVEAAPGVG